jgi:hypothetical protein
MIISIIDISSEEEMPDGRKLFGVTQWVLRAGIIVTMVLIGMYVLGVAAMIFALITSRVPLDRIAHWTGATMTADEIGRMALAAFAGAIAALTLIQLILRALRRVVASASVGDPSSRRMRWISSASPGSSLASR